MNFYNRVYQLIQKIPKRKVATYGQIAALASSPRAARMVGTALRNLSGDTSLPWHRVIGSGGRLTIENLAVPKAEQARRLQVEGIAVKFKDGNYWVDLKKYLWRP